MQLSLVLKAPAPQVAQAAVTPATCGAVVSGTIVDPFKLYGAGFQATPGAVYVACTDADGNACGVGVLEAEHFDDDAAMSAAAAAASHVGDELR
jgi:hypothetical protein